MDLNDAYRITDPDALQALYGQPSDASIIKEVDYVHPHYRAFIEASSFVILATVGPDGLDASPRGDPGGFVTVADDKTLLIPDRRGNNRIDSLRNILADPRVGLLFLVPGVGETLRVNGRASLSTDPNLLARFPMNDKPPRSVLVVHVETVFFQCSRAILRSALWDPASQVDRADLPTAGRILADLSAGTFDGTTYDRELPQRIHKTLY
ncbi:pyridoxamine 5'-phosphate oxidase family protein [Bordetella tumulicola]|uniref:pyridoxamine 5'-phosphate oxidase family protein n=1 Tax=Bordetella tumulicola TaxID=1649133 RepID=UPI0039EEFAD2